MKTGKFVESYMIFQSFLRIISQNVCLLGTLRGEMLHLFLHVKLAESSFLAAVLSCTDTADSYTKDKFVVDCPAGCDGITDKLWGTTVYTDDSYICAAAIHDGRIRGRIQVWTFDSCMNFANVHGCLLLLLRFTRAASMLTHTRLSMSVEMMCLLKPETQHERLGLHLMRQITARYLRVDDFTYTRVYYNTIRYSCVEMLL